MRIIKISKSKLNGSINIPSSKSVAARYLFSSIFSEKNIKISGFGFNKDISSYFNVVKKIKPLSKIEFLSDNKFLIEIDREINSLLLKKDDKNYISFDCKDSGFCLRAISIILSFFPSKSFVKGSKQLLARPHNMLYQTIKQGKGKIWFSKEDEGFFIEGPILPSTFKLNTNISSQHISGLFMTLPFLKGDSVIFLKNYESSSFIYLTLDILKRGNLNIEKVEKSKIEKFIYHNYNEKYIIKGNSKLDYKSEEESLLIEADWSSAANFMVAAALGGKITFNNLNIDSKQPDAAILEALKMVGAEILIDKNITIKRNELKGFDCDISNCPDLFPSISILASFCEGKSRIYGIKRLKYKESDRLNSVVENFAKAKIKFEVKKDYFTIYGNPNYIGKKADDEIITLSSFSDHRIFMAFSIFGCFFNKNIEIVDNFSYKKSYENFLNDFISLGGKIEERDE